MEEKLMEFMVGFQQQIGVLIQEQREGFREVHQRLDKVDQRLDKLEARMDKLEERMDKLEARMSKLELRMDKLEERMDQLEARMDKLEYKLDLTFDQVAASAEDLTEMKTVISFRFEAHRNIMARTEEDVELLKVKIQNN
ncbi:Chromosome partition protein Smc [compost metagenome]